MKHKIFYLTEFCNLKCKYCYEHNPENKNFMDIWTFQKDLLDVYKDSNLKDEVNIVLTGGEPMTNWKLITEICEWKSMFNFPIKTNFCIVTNGTLLTKEKIKFLVDNDIEIQVSYDGRTTDKYRGEGVHKKLLEIFGWFRELEYFGKLSLSWCVYDDNIGWLHQDIRYINVFYPGVFKQIIFLPVDNLLKDYKYNKVIEVANELHFANICHHLCKQCQNPCSSKNEKDGYDYYLSSGGNIKTKHIGIKGSFNHFSS